jgi:hypothetical protein
VMPWLHWIMFGQCCLTYELLVMLWHSIMLANAAFYTNFLWCHGIELCLADVALRMSFCDVVKMNFLRCRGIDLCLATVVAVSAFHWFHSSHNVGVLSGVVLFNGRPVYA